MTLPPTIEDLEADEDNDNEFTEDPCNEEEDKVQPDFPDEEDDGDDDDEDDDEVQMGTQSRPRASKSVANEVMEFDEDMHDITGYEKADIIELRNEALDSNAMYAKKIKGTLLNRPPGSLPSLEQINSSELFALRAPQKNMSMFHCLGLTNPTFLWGE